MTEYTKDDSQVDVQAICKKHNIGRYKLIEVSTFVARVLGLRPQLNSALAFCINLSICNILFLF